MCFALWMGFGCKFKTHQMKRIRTPIITHGRVAPTSAMWYVLPLMAQLYGRDITVQVWRLLNVIKGGWGYHGDGDALMCSTMWLWVSYHVIGSWHDVRVSEPLFELLESNHTPDPFHLIADCGFHSQSYKVTTYDVLHKTHTLWCVCVCNSMSWINFDHEITLP